MDIEIYKHDQKRTRRRICSNLSLASHSTIQYHKTVAMHCHTFSQFRDDVREKFVLK